MKDCNDNVLSRMAETPLFANLSESERMSLATALYRAIDKLTRNDATKDLVKAHLKMR